MAGKAHRRRSTRREPKEFQEEVIEIRRVTKVVKGGRRLRFRALVVIGNQKGKVGIGLGKSNEVTTAIQKAISQAKKRLITVNLDNFTIPHEVKVKFKAAKILLMPAAPGTGLIAGGTIRKVLALAGVKNILSKSLGTTNKVNTTKAAIEALKMLEVTPGMAERAKKRAAAKVKNDKVKKEEKKNHQEAKGSKDTKADKAAPKKKEPVKKTEKAEPKAKKETKAKEEKKA